MTPRAWSLLKLYVGSKTGHGKLQLLAKMNEIEIAESKSFIEQLESVVTDYKNRGISTSSGVSIATKITCDDLLQYAKDKQIQGDA